MVSPLEFPLHEVEEFPGLPPDARLIEYRGKERMGGEVKTDTNEEFKALESEMQLRSQGNDIKMR